MLYLAVSLSVLGLAVGPLLLAWGRGRTLPTAAMEGLTLGLVPAVVLLRLLPHVYEEVGPLSIALLAAGYVLLWVVERRRHRSLGRVGQAVALPALLVHSTVDGATLGVALAAGSAPEGGALLAAAVLIHRLPEGLFVARALVPEVGWPRAISWLGVLACATVAGAVLGDRVLSAAPPGVFHGVVAVGLGAILRLITHTHDHRPPTRAGVATFVSALALGILVNALVPAASLHDRHEGHAHDAGAAEAAGVVALVVVVAMGLLRFAPASWRARFAPAHDHGDHGHEEADVTLPARVHAHAHAHPHEVEVEPRSGGEARVPPP